MKKTFVVWLFIILACQKMVSQDPGSDITAFRGTVLPQYSTYFKSAGLSPAGQLVLSANDAYASLSVNSKTAIMDNLMKKWTESLILVNYGSKSELWGWNIDTGKALRLDGWDVNAARVSNAPVNKGTRTALHPFFVYVGGQGILDSEHNLNAGLSTRVGFFLLKNRWDLAWTLSGAVIGNIDSTTSSSNQLSTGLMTKFYFPIKSLKLSPNVGIDLQSTVISSSEGSSSQAANRAVLAGVSWYVGQGSLDFGLRQGLAKGQKMSATIGYTIMPGTGKKRK
jgi:hypothetical protein